MLFASTVINYLDRQTLSNLAPYLKKEYGWTNTDYANLIIAFRLAYSVGQTLSGKLLDRIGTRRGLTISVFWYSVVSMLTSLATGWKSFAGKDEWYYLIRFLPEDKRVTPILTTMLPNWSGSDRRPRVSMLNWRAPGDGTGGWFSTPEATWTFCARSAATTSPAVMERAAIFSGSNQIRIA